MDVLQLLVSLWPTVLLASRGAAAIGAGVHAG